MRNDGGAAERGGGALVAHPGTQHSRQAALALQERGVLRRYVTGGFYYRPNGVAATVARALPGGARRRVVGQLRRRRFEALDDRLVASSDVIELLHQAYDRVVPPGQLGFRFFRYRQAAFQRRVSRMVERLRPRVVVCYDTAALGVFDAARRVGACCVLDQTTGHLSRAIREYSAAGVEPGQSEEVLADTLAEVRAADAIVTSSRYVQDSLTDIGVPLSRIIVIPYGVDLERFRPKELRADDGVVRALYVGRLSERKGVHYVCEAFDRLALPNLELTLLGAPHGPGAWDAPRDARFVRRGAVPHHEVHEAYHRADLFIQMSLHESSAMTIYEALASGLPVVTTPNSGSVVRDGMDGFIVPPGDVDALADRVRLLVGDRALREEMGRNARRRAEEFSWERYRERFGSLIVDLLDAPAPDGWQRVVDEHRRRMADVLGTVGGAGLGESGESGASSTTGAIGAGNGGED